MRYLILPFLALACSEPAPLPSLSPVDTVYVSNKFSPEENEALLDGADLWNRGTLGTVRLNLVVSDRPSTSVLFIDKVALKGDARGNAGTFTIRMDTDEGYSGPDLAMTFAHEVGHKFGIGHLSTGMMMEVRDPNEHCIDADTLITFCSLWPCPNGFASVCLIPR
jgi:hypothetical protein